MALEFRDVTTVVRGPQGEAGFSPQIEPQPGNDAEVYKLVVTTKFGSFVTPNLKGGGGTGSGPALAGTLASLTVRLTPDGITTVFSLPDEASLEQPIMAYVNGLLQRVNVHYFVTTENRTITFVIPPETTDVVEVEYYTEFDGVDEYALVAIVPDGLTNTFDLPVDFDSDKQVEVYVNGLRQREWTHFVIERSTIVFTEYPLATDDVVIKYVRKR
jgi:hypothetical protein